MKRTKGCIDCKYYHTEYGKPRTCKLGFNDEMTGWWERNGKKKRSEENLEEMVCFEETELTKILNTTLEKVDELLNLMKNK